ncbi:MAG TPA: CHASE domain-containing protein [Pyrinomonadaceae bacterium]
MTGLLKRLTPGENVENKIVKLPYLVLAISIILSLGVTLLIYKNALSRDSIRFNNSVNRVQSAIENRLNLYIALLKGGRGFVESTDKLTREKFADYVKSIELEKNYAGVQGIGFNKVLTAAEREDLIKQMKYEGYADFKIFPEGEREIYQAIIYLEPYNERNRKVIGFDMSSEENRRQALFRARDLGAEALTAKVALLQESEQEKQAGFLLYLPIYKGAKIPSTVDERRANLAGYIYSPFRAEDFLNEILVETSPEVAVKIYDNELKPENLLAQSAANDARQFETEKDDAFHTKNNLDIAGRRWVVEYVPLPILAEQSNLRWVPVVFVLGVVCSFLLFGITYAESSSRAKIQKIAAELFELERQKQTLLEKEQGARLVAEQANMTKDEFISVVSHELRTPLNAIAGWAKILKTENLSENTKELALQKIEKNLRSQTKLVEELLDYSQIISGKINLDAKQFDFSGVFESAFNEMEPKAHSKDISLVKHNQLNGQKIVGDREKIKIVVRNLISNAIKFTPAGGKIEVDVEEKNQTIEMTVKDTGRGISREFLPHIFDRFRQDDGSTTRFYGGLGLGLAISEHIVKLHKGSIEAYSEGKEKGSIFIVKIPCEKC